MFIANLNANNLDWKEHYAPSSPFYGNTIKGRSQNRNILRPPLLSLPDYIFFTISLQHDHRLGAGGLARGSESGAVAGAVVIVDFFSVLVCVEVAHWDAYT